MVGEVVITQAKILVCSYPVLARGIARIVTFQPMLATEPRCTDVFVETIAA
jgi:hypothetical protein